MVQSIFAGGTNYEVQTLADILEDVKYWINYAVSVKEFMKKNENILTSDNLLNEISSNFQATMKSSIFYFETIIVDLKLVKEAIEIDQVTQREVLLLKEIGIQSRKLNIEYGKYWHEDNRNHYCEIAEKMYAKGRDFFITLQDALNAGERLGKYMRNTSLNKINIVGNVNNSQIQQNNTNSTQTMITEVEFPYDKVLDSLIKIKEMYKKNDFDEGFGLKAEQVRKDTDEIIELVKVKEDQGVIKKFLKGLRDIVINVGSNVIATEILKELTIYI